MLDKGWLFLHTISQVKGLDTQNTLCLLIGDTTGSPKVLPIFQSYFSVSPCSEALRKGFLWIEEFRWPACFPWASSLWSLIFCLPPCAPSHKSISIWRNEVEKFKVLVKGKKAWRQMTIFCQRFSSCIFPEVVYSLSTGCFTPVFMAFGPLKQPHSHLEFH